ncbi:MAG: hypothetical protein HOV81_27895 [Kofleriaceae bacterium]|nr:hypothetical protein [Kofleriaceae bacterium]
MTRAALILVVLAACVDRGAGPQPKKIDPGYVRENILVAPPQTLKHLDVDLGGGKVGYLGSQIAYSDGRDPATPLAPGGGIRIKHYWQVRVPPGPGWKVFSYLRGDAGTADFMNLGPTDMQIGLPVEKWKAGQVIQDVQDFMLRPDWRSQKATLYVGLVQEHGHQIGDRMAASGPSVVDRAIVAATIDVDLSKAPPPAGTIYVPRAAAPITIDGIANDPGWASAAISPEFATADGSPDPVGRAIARMTWDDQNLYVFVSVNDSDVYSPYKNHDDPLWKSDCVEMFIDADGNRRGYVELQVNPNNATFDSFFATTRAQPGDEKWTSNMVTGVVVRGTGDKSGDADSGWDVEIAVPLAAVKGNDPNMPIALPPQVGDRWRLNVVRVDTRSGGGNPSATSWNRISYSDFHALDRMLTVVFADSQGSIKPQPVAPTAPSPSPTEASPPAPTTAPAKATLAPAGATGAVQTP